MNKQWGWIINCSYIDSQRWYVSCINHNKEFVKKINSIKEELIKTLKDRILNNKFNKSKVNVIKQIIKV